MGGGACATVGSGGGVTRGRWRRPGEAPV